MKSDAELLRDYRRRGDETAFRLLVERHAGLVQGAALRRTEDVELAREAAQQVFVLLAKNAGRLYAGTGLAGWLHRTAVLVSANLKRREEKRGRVMKRYEHHVVLTSKPESASASDLESHSEAAGGSGWSAALPLVDEGLTRLPEADRQILQAHFWQGLTYQEIAAARSSTEAAVQRRASRAFVKLGRWLGKRRAVISGGVLTAGLSTLSQPASAAGFSAAGPLASRVLADLAAASSSTSLWGWRIREMLSFGKMKFAGGLLTGTFVALLGGVGFAKGRSVARLEQAHRQFAHDLAEAESTLAGLTSSRLETEPAPRRSLAELIAEAADHYRNEADPAGTARGQILLEQVLPDEIPEALAMLEGSLGETSIVRLMVPQLLGRWRFAEKADDPVRWVLEKIRDDEAFRTGLQSAIGAWASREPEAARTWWLERTELHGRADGFGIHHAILMGYTHEQLESVWPQLHLVEDDEFQAAANLFALRVKDPATRPELHERISAMPDERTRAELFKRTGRILAQSDPEESVIWTKDLPLSDPKEAFMVRMETAAKLLENHPLLATRIVLQNPPGPMRDLAMEGFRKTFSNKSK